MNRFFDLDFVVEEIAPQTRRFDFSFKQVEEYHRERIAPKTSHSAWYKSPPQVSGTNELFVEFRNRFLSKHSRRAGIEQDSDLSETSIVEVHCECALLAHFVNNSIPAYGYIGVSRLPCLSCFLYFKSYNFAVDILRPDGIPANQTGVPAAGRRYFYVRGTREDVPFKWKKPRLNDPELEEELVSKFSRRADKRFRNVLGVPIEERRKARGKMSSMYGPPVPPLEISLAKARALREELKSMYPASHFSPDQETAAPPPPPCDGTGQESSGMKRKRSESRDTC